MDWHKRRTKADKRLIKRYCEYSSPSMPEPLRAKANADKRNLLGKQKKPRGNLEAFKNSVRNLHQSTVTLSVWILPSEFGMASVVTFSRFGSLISVGPEQPPEQTTKLPATNKAERTIFIGTNSLKVSTKGFN